jgi:two-component system sensor histidine kinase AtoS
MTNMDISVAGDSLRLPKNLGLNELVALMNILPEAAFLYDRKRDVISQANRLFLSLSLSGYRDIQQVKFGEILSGEAIPELWEGGYHKLSLQRKNEPAIAVSVSANALDESKQWWLINVLPTDRARKYSDTAVDDLINGIMGVVKLDQIEEYDQYIDRVGDLIQLMLKVGFVSIYQAVTEPPILRELVCKGEFKVFPYELPASDLIRLRKRTLWSPGKKVVTEVHRSAKDASLSVVVSVPLGEKGLFGLLVIGDMEREPVDLPLSVLDLLGGLLTNTLQKFTLIQDIQERIETLQSTASIGSSAIENSECGLIIVNPDFIIEQINASAQTIFGYEQAEVMGQPVETVLIGSNNPVSMLENSLAQLSPLEDSFSLHRRDGQMFPARLHFIPIIQDNKLLSYIVMVNDITEHEQFRTQQQHLENRAELGDITAMFAHEVRNPINNISAGLQLLASRMNTDDPNQSVVSRILVDCNRLDQLMDSVLAYSRPMTPKFEVVDIGFLIRRLIERYKPKFTKYNITSYSSIGSDCPKVLGDSGALERVFINLINNSIDAMNETGGTLAIRAEISNLLPNRPQIEVTVSDNGPGIPDEIRERIFEAFTTYKQKGTGLGLAITKRIITAHHGSIRVNSFPGGTVFHVFLPAIVDGEEK